MNPIQSFFKAKGLWAIDAPRLQGFLGTLEGAKLRAEERGPFATAPRRKTLSIDDSGTARVRIEGVLMSYVPNIVRWLSLPATSYPDIRQDIEDAVSDPKVKGLRLLVASPGGMTGGVEGAVAAVAEARNRLKTSARITDIGASAAYWLASQAEKLEATPTALVGSIGAYAVLEDSSGAAEQQGVKVHVIRSGPHKGTGVPGAPVTPAELETYQAIVDGLAAMFKADVARGRKVTAAKVDEWADGRAWLAGEALKLGLIDAISEPAALPPVARQAPKAEGPKCTTCYTEIAAKEAKELELAPGTRYAEHWECSKARARRAREEAERKAAAVQAAPVRPTSPCLRCRSTTTVYLDAVQVDKSAAPRERFRCGSCETVFFAPPEAVS